MENTSRFRKLLKARRASYADLTIYVDPSFIFKLEDGAPELCKHKRCFDAVRFIALGGDFKGLSESLSVSVGRARDIFNKGVRLINLYYKRFIDKGAFSDYKIISDNEFIYRRNHGLLSDGEFSQSQLKYIKSLIKAKKRDVVKIRINDTRLCKQIAAFIGAERAQGELAIAFHSYESNDGFDFDCDLEYAFNWKDTAQGVGFWDLINEGVKRCNN